MPDHEASIEDTSAPTSLCLSSCFTAHHPPAPNSPDPLLWPSLAPHSHAPPVDSRSAALSITARLRRGRGP